jgi:O-methyltransferase involved in polyketide biosynthesis
MAGPPYARDFLERALALLAHRRVEEALRKADAHTQRAVVDLIGVAHAACDGAIDEQCIALHDALLVKLGAG